MKLTFQTRATRASLEDADFAWALWNNKRYDYARRYPGGEIVFFGTRVEALSSEWTGYDVWRVSRYVRYRAVSPVIAGSELERIEAGRRYGQRSASSERFYEWLNDARYDALNRVAR